MVVTGSMLNNHQSLQGLEKGDGFLRREQTNNTQKALDNKKLIGN